MANFKTTSSKTRRLRHSYFYYDTFQVIYVFVKRMVVISTDIFYSLTATTNQKFDVEKNRVFAREHHDHERQLRATS
jgi:hypothetical protein